MEGSLAEDTTNDDTVAGSIEKATAETIEDSSVKDTVTEGTVAEDTVDEDITDKDIAFKDATISVEDIEDIVAKDDTADATGHSSAKDTTTEAIKDIAVEATTSENTVAEATAGSNGLSDSKGLLEEPSTKLGDCLAIDLSNITEEDFRCPDKNRLQNSEFSSVLLSSFLILVQIRR